MFECYRFKCQLWHVALNKHDEALRLSAEDEISHCLMFTVSPNFLSSTAQSYSFSTFEAQSILEAMNTLPNIIFQSTWLLAWKNGIEAQSRSPFYFADALAGRVNSHLTKLHRVIAGFDER